jgi:uncharacterized protein
VKPRLAVICTLALLGACAAQQPDHFYILSTQPPAPGIARTSPATPVLLRVALAPVFDRSALMLNTSPGGVSILEHDRWAAPLSDLMRETLARNLEARRSDLVVSSQGAAHSDGPAVRISVDVVQVVAQSGANAGIEAHWHIVDARSGKDQWGGEVLSASSSLAGYAGVAEALSRCLGSLADRLISQMN